MKVKTVFQIDGEQYSIEATGQEAVKAMRKQFKRVKMVLLGFMINDVFIKSVI